MINFKWDCSVCKLPVTPWKTLGACFLVVGLTGWFWTRQHRELVDARRQSEEYKLKAQGQIVAEQESSHDLRDSVTKLLAENELIKQAYEEALRLAPDARPDSAASLGTGPVSVASAPRPTDPVPEPERDDHPPAPPPCDRPLVPDGMGSFLCPGAAVKPQAECTLAAGDLGSFHVDEVILKTAKENYLLVGTAEFWRERPLPRAKLAAGKFTSALSDVSALAPPAAPRWGVEAAGQCNRDGCGLGVGVLLPPFRVPLLGWHGEARLDAYAGPTATLAGALGVRF